MASIDATGALTAPKTTADDWQQAMAVWQVGHTLAPPVLRRLPLLLLLRLCPAPAPAASLAPAACSAAASPAPAPTSYYNYYPLQACTSAM